MTTEGNEERPEATEPTDELAEMRAVVAKAKAGDASALPRLREILDRNPSLVKHYGDIGKHAQAAWVALAAGRSLYLKETLARAADARRAELTRPGASPVERLLVERVVACDLQLGYLTTAEADALGAGDNYRQLDFQAKRVERAQRMLLSATSALVAYQRLVPQPVVLTASAALPAQTLNGQADTQQPAAQVPLAVQLFDAGSEPDDGQSESRERLSVQVTN